MKTIYKYPLKAEDAQRISMPDGAQPLSVQMQHGKACLWALVDTDMPHVAHTIYVHGTGHTLEDAQFKKYISTFQMSGGDLVFHAFYDIRSRESDNEK